MKRPSFQFYPSDWRTDGSLQTCSLAARGLWIELLCIMHESKTYGFLSINDRKMDTKQIARLVGESAAKTQRLLDELERAGVFSRDEQSTIYSRRMKKDEHIRSVRSAAGSLGGNPVLLKQKDSENADLLNQDCNQILTPSSSSSSSSSSTKKKDKTCASSPDDAPTRNDPIPYQEIVDSYNATMDRLAKVRELTPKRRTLIRTAWQASDQRRCMDFWKAYFAECADDPFLSGVGPYREPHANWRPTFDYLLKPEVVTRVFESAMHRMEQSS